MDKYCCICNKKLPDKTLRRSIWKTCDNPQCRKEANRRKAKVYDEKIRRSVDNPPPERQIKIDKMRAEIGTREELLSKKVEIKLERKPVEVKVFKITDLAKFEAGGSGTYEGLEFERIEYAKEFIMPFNAGLGEIERDIYVER